MAEQFPPLSAATLAAANQVGAWLAQDDLATLPALPQVDVVVLAGNAVIPTIDAACRLAAAQAVPLLISGGRGTFYELSLRGGAPGYPLPYVAGGGASGSACSGRYCS
ncbi:protein ydcF [Klebsiella pneumoniae]|nr:protein ydcF [Klebsiella pneumoniae]